MSSSARKIFKAVAFIFLSSCASPPPAVQPEKLSPPIAAVPAPAPPPLPSVDDTLRQMRESQARIKPYSERWVRCTQQAAAGIALASNDPAESLIGAVFAACSRHEEAFRIEMLRTGLSVARAEEVIARTREIGREHIALIIVETRAKPVPERRPPTQTPI